MVTTSPNATAVSSFHSDVLIIGGGVVGCAIAREVCLRTPHSVVLLEAMSSVLRGASAGNSAMIHSGFDCTPGTTEAAMVKRGHGLFEEFTEQCSVTSAVPLPWARCGAVMLAMNEDELLAIRATVIPKAEENGVPVTLLPSREAVTALEPHVSRNVVGGLLIPGEWCVDPWLVPATYLAHGYASGRLRIVCGARVTRAERVNGAVDSAAAAVSSSCCSSSEGSSMRWKVTCAPRAAHPPSSSVATMSHYYARWVINAAGLHGDAVERLRYPSAATPPFLVFPRLGRFVAFDSGATPFVRRALLPLPTAKTKGVIVFPTVYGQVVVGPTAEDPDEPRLPQAAVREFLRQEAFRKIPVLERVATPLYEFAGARPALRGRADYFLDVVADSGGGDGWMVVAGVRSTGLTACLALAEHVVNVGFASGSSSSVSPRPDRQKWLTPKDIRAALLRLNADGVLSLAARHPISLEGWPTARL